MAKGLIHYTRKRGEATGAFGKAAMRVAKRVGRGARRVSKTGRAGISAAKTTWIKERYGTVLTPGEKREAESAWKIYMERDMKRREKMRAAKRGSRNLSVAAARAAGKLKGRKPRKKKATYKSAKF